MIPKKLKNLNLFVDGDNYMGKVDTLTLPVLTRNMEEARYGGMNAPLEFDMGMEKLESSFVLAEYSDELYKHWGITDIAGIMLRMRGAVEAEDGSGVIGLEIVQRGRWRSINMGDWKVAEASTLTIEGALSFFEYIANGQSLIKIDVPSMVEIVGGVDRLAEQRRALGI